MGKWCRDTHGEKTKQPQEAVKVSARNAVDVDQIEVDVDGISLKKENFKEINGEILDQTSDFQSYY